MYTCCIKRLLDFLLSLFFLVLLLPIFLIVMLLLLIAHKGNPFFFQIRPGKNERLFRMVKFKTMSDQHDHKGNLLPDTQRLTRIGNIVRKTSLDELPQLINVLKGEMSLVGPRPLLIEYLPLYSKEQARRHEVCPGMTGWAQVNGRNAIGWSEKFELDSWYVDHVSFVLDLKIILKTIVNVIRSEGIVGKDNVTMEKFTRIYKYESKP